MDATLQIKRNGGSPQTGGVRGASGDSVQLTAADKTAWPTATHARWNIFCYTAGVTCPAGWSTDTDDALAPTFFFVGNGDPPPFTAAPGTYDLQLLVTGLPVDERTSLKVASARGTYRIGRREGAQFGGAKRRWIADINASLDAIEARGPLPPVDCWLDAQNSTGQASDANPGTEAKPWLTLDRARDGFFELMKNVSVVGAQTEYTLHLLSDVNGDIRLGVNWGAAGPMIPAVDGQPGRVAGQHVVVSAAQAANPSPTASTTIASGSNGLSLPQATINVADASLFTSGSPIGTIEVLTSNGVQTVTCTGKTATSITGCLGGTGTMSTGAAVKQAPTEWRVYLTDATSGLPVSPIPAGTYVEVTSGPRASNGFVVLHDWGGGNASVVEPNIALQYGFTGVGSVQATDPAQVFMPTKFGDSLYVTGLGGISFQMIRVPGRSTQHDVRFIGCTVFLDTCLFSTGWDVGGAGGGEAGGGEAQAAGCWSGLNAHSYGGALIFTGCGSNGGVVTHFGGTAYFSDFTMFGGVPVSVDDVSTAFVGGWLAHVNQAQAVSIDNGSTFKVYAGGKHFGTGISGTKIAIAAGGSYYTDGANLPNITGFGGTDSTIGGTSKAFAAWPYVELTNLAKAVAA